MKLRTLKWLAAIMLALFTVIPAVSLPAQQPVPKRTEQPKEQIVYVTRTGKKYHREGCRYLSASKIPMALKDAKERGYTACKVCRPPQ